MQVNCFFVCCEQEEYCTSLNIYIFSFDSLLWFNISYKALAINISVLDQNHPSYLIQIGTVRSPPLVIGSRYRFRFQLQEF